MEGASSGDAAPRQAADLAKQDAGGGAASNLQSAARTKPDVLPMEHPAKKSRTEAPRGSSSASVQYGAPPPPPRIEKRYTFHELFSKVSPSVVTVAGVEEDEGTSYGTGFILMSNENHSFIFTSMLTYKFEERIDYYVYFKPNVKTEADILCCDKEFMILVVQDSEKRVPIIFSKAPAKYEFIVTVGAMAGTMLHANTSAIHTLIGVLGCYKGEVTTPDCTALDALRKPLRGSEKYFQVSCSVQDEIVSLENVDKKNHTANVIVSAPVLRLNGEMIGLIHSAGSWCDMKNGLHTKHVISLINRMLPANMYPTSTRGWEEKLKEVYELWLLNDDAESDDVESSALGSFFCA